MSDTGYDEDFEDYDEDFESDHELEVPDQPAQTSAAALDEAWPSLTAAAAVKQKPRAATQFTRSLITGGGSGFGAAPAQSAAPDGISYFISPASPPLTDTQRTKASKTLTRSLQLQQQVKLSLSPLYNDLLVLQPMSAYQQLALGVGAYADKVAAASQARQLDQELHEQDVQTEEIELQDSSCQAPDVMSVRDNSSSGTSRPFSKHSISDPSATAGSRSTAAASKLLESDTALSDFIDWAVPELIHELGKAAAVAAAVAEEGSKAAANRQTLPFSPTSINETTLSRNTSSSAVSKPKQPLISGHITLQSSSLLASRAVRSLACPPTPAAAAAAATAISAATAVTVSKHLLLICCSPVAMTAEAALREHGLPGMGCLCVWDLLQPQQPVQVLVCEGRPSCCCWGVGAGGCLVFAGMEEGGTCCWDLSEPNSSHIQQQQQSETASKQQQQQGWPPPRRPSYTTETPLLPLEDITNTGSSSSSRLLAHLSGVDSIVGSAAAAAAGSLSAGAAAAGGSVCQLITLSSSGNVVLYSVMMGAAGSSSGAAALSDLGMRAGSRVWLVKIVEGLPLGIEAAKPPHLRQQAAAAVPATSLAMLPGPSQQILVGMFGSKILRGACLGTPAPPREYITAEWQPLGYLNQGSALESSSGSSSSEANTAAVADNGGRSPSSSVLGSAVSLSVCPAVPEAWLAGFSSGDVALFGVNRSRPVLMWQQMRTAPVVAARWVATRPCMFMVLHTDGQLLVYDLSQTTKQPVVTTNLQRPNTAANGSSYPCSMELLVHSSTSTSAAPPAASSSRDLRFRSNSSKTSRSGASTSQGGGSAVSTAQCSVVVGYDDGSAVVFQLGAEWGGSQQQDEEERQLQQLLVS